MNPINTAVNSGYSTEQILDFLVRKFPKYKKKITQALGKGYSAGQILSFLSGKGDDVYGNTEHEITLTRDLEKRKRNEKNVALAAATLAAGTGSALTRAALPTTAALEGELLPAQTQIAQQIPKQLPYADQELIGNISTQEPSPESPQTPISPTPEANQTTDTSQEPLSQEEQALFNIQERRKESDRLFDIAASQRIKKENMTPFMRIARSLIKSGKVSDRETFDEFRKYWAATEGQPRGNSFVEFERFRVSKPKMIEPEKQQQSKAALQSEEIQAKPIEKGSFVITPSGVGEVKAIQNGKSLVDIDGKKQAFDESKLLTSPISQKNLADLYDDLIQGIEQKTKQEISKNVEWAGYDPKTNELAYKPHGAAFYVYTDINPEDAKALTEVLTQRKTSGENYIGVWKAGTDSPIGAAMSQLIQRLQKERGGKGSEYRNKFETIYDAIEPARSASKNRYLERKKAERKKK